MRCPCWIICCWNSWNPWCFRLHQRCTCPLFWVETKKIQQRVKVNVKTWRNPFQAIYHWWLSYLHPVRSRTIKHSNIRVCLECLASHAYLRSFYCQCIVGMCMYIIWHAKQFYPNSCHFRTEHPEDSKKWSSHMANVMRANIEPSLLSILSMIMIAYSQTGDHSPKKADTMHPYSK